MNRLEKWKERADEAEVHEWVAENAPNPLLSTVMALVHAHKGGLPDARALLYEETVAILLCRWEQIKTGGGEHAAPLRRLLREARCTNADLMRVLWELTFDAHARGGNGKDSDALADIGERQLEKALGRLNSGDRNWAMKLVETMKLRAGLLLERPPEVFTFSHLSHLRTLNLRAPDLRPPGGRRISGDLPIPSFGSRSFRLEGLPLRKPEKLKNGGIEASEKHYIMVPQRTLDFS